MFMKVHFIRESFQKCIPPIESKNVQNLKWYEISKGTFEIPNKISDPYIERYDFV